MLLALLKMVLWDAWDVGAEQDKPVVDVGDVTAMSVG